MRTAGVLLLLLLSAVTSAHAQNVPVTGTVRDESTREPIPGATIRVLGGTRGTYSSREGVYRLPLPRGEHRIVVSSIGYESDTLTVSTSAPRADVSLRSAPIETSEVSVTAELTADDVVRNAIARKQQNLDRLKTFNALLYSKMSLGIEGDAFGQIGDEDRATILETFSRYYFDREQSPPFQIEVLNRRQTANIPSEANVFALGNFFSFYDDELRLLNARVMTPLAEEAFSRYRFEFAGRSKLAGQTVYLIRVIPTTRLLPAFSGTMKIIKGTYNLVEVDLRPTDATAIAFVRDLRFVQRFELLEHDVWYPTFLEITGSASVEIVKGIAQIDATLRATSIVSEAVVNEPIPDSVFARRVADDEDGRSIITAAADVDSARSEFWENNALSELSEEEKETYERIDSLVAEADTMSRQQERLVGYSLKPNVDFNRVGGWSLFGGVDVFVSALVDVGVSAGYSFGLKRMLGEANISITPFEADGLSVSAVGSTFSRLDANHWDRAIPRIVNTVTASLFHRDYYDWYRHDGWSAGLRVKLWDVALNGAYERSQQFTERNRVHRSLFVDDVLRPNPRIVDGSFGVVTATAAYGNVGDAIVISSGSSSGLGVRFSALSGREHRDEQGFEAIEGRLLLELPTIGTGYLPMSLRVATHAGIASDEIPQQYMFRMRTAASIVAPFGHFLTAPTGVYGGSEYLALHAEHNFSDIVWRWLGLPTYWGRGIEIIAGASTGRWRRPALPLGDPSDPFITIADYIPTHDEWYSEAGIGLGRIPTFISNVVFLRLDARMGVGPLARGNWGLSLSLTSPF